MESINLSCKWENSEYKNPCILGIDEAGRGPVLGPMVYGTAFCPINKENSLNQIEFKDSKILTSIERENLFHLIQNTDWLGYHIIPLSASYLSACMLRRYPYNLNSISHDTAIELIRTVLNHGVNITKIYVDTVGDPMKYQNKLSDIFPNIDITVSKKADSIYKIVSVASICAKVTRDKILKEFTFTEPISFSRNFGSGYPADPEAKQWLIDNFDPIFGFPDLARFSWSTCKKIIKEKGVRFTWDDEENNEKQSTIMQYTNSQQQEKRSKFFRLRNMQHVSSNQF